MSFPNSLSLFKSSLSLLKSSSHLPLAELQAHQRNVAFGYVQLFSRFGSEVCGCDSPEDRVKLRKSVWLQTSGLRLREFERRFPHASDSLKKVAAMECPVQLSQKSAKRGDESAPSKIVLASKLLRSHFALTEATTCRGCSKRGRCPFARKIVPNRKDKTSLGAPAKVLFGLSQSSRLFLKDPLLHPLIISPADMEAAVTLLGQLGRFLAPSAVERQLASVPVADRRAVKAIVDFQIKKNKEMAEGRKTEGVEMVKQVDSVGVKKDEGKKVKFFDIDSEDWVPEEKREELSEPSLLFPPVQPESTTNSLSNRSVQSLDRLSDIPISPARLVVVPEKKKTVRFQDFKKLTFDLNSPKPSLPSPPNADPSRGYVLGQPGEVSSGVEYIKSQFLRQRTVLDNVNLAGKLWSQSNPYVSELKFLKPFPYEESVNAPRLREKGDDLLLAKQLQRGIAVGGLDEGQAGEASKVTRDGDDTGSFNEWKKRSSSSKDVGRRTIGLMSNRLGSGEVVNPDRVNVVTGSLESQSLFEKAQLGVTTSKLSKVENLGEKRCDEEGFVQIGNLKFPKLPQWEVRSSGGVAGKVVDPNGGMTERVRMDYKSLMRPEGSSLDATKEMKRAKRNRTAKIKAKSATDIAGLWKVKQ